MGSSWRPLRPEAAASLMETPFAAPAKLHEGGPCSQNRLGRLIDLDVAAIKGIVDRLRTRGLVETGAIQSSASDPPSHSQETRRQTTLAAITAAASSTAAGTAAVIERCVCRY